MPKTIQANIIILTHNNLEYTRQCIESVFAKTTHPEFEIIVVDNGSEDETPQYLTSLAATQPQLKVILNEHNEGFSRGNNMGAAEASGEFLVFLNNDTIVTHGWLDGLIKHLKNPAVGMVGPVTNASGNQTRIAVDYANLEDMERFAAGYTKAHAGQIFEIDMLPFLCVALRRDVFEEIGPLDERFGIGMFEDDDYAMRMKEKGYKILCAEDVFVHHFGGASFSRVNFAQYWSIYQQNLKKFEDKWGIQWLPPLQRTEFIQHQLRQMTDASIFFTQEIVEREENIINITNQFGNLKNNLADLTIRYQERDLTASHLTIRLDDIYASNGWALVQKILRIRRFFIPEGSNREKILQRFISFIRRSPSTQRTQSLITSTKNTPIDASVYSPMVKTVSRDQTSLQTSDRSSVMDLSTNLFPERFAWPFVSVIIPVYNHADMLEAAARSVLDGTYSNLELIILDDGSTDEIKPVLKKLLTNPRVRVFNQPNQKLPRTLTHAHHIAQGDFITWTSADNWMAPNAIESMVNCLLNNPQAVLVYADVAVVDDQGEMLLDYSYRPQNQDPSQPGFIRLHRDSQSLGYEADNYINACFLYRREAALAMEGYYADDLRGLEDYDFWLRMQKCGKFVHLGNEKPIYYYRVHKRTMSHELLTQERDEHIKRIDELISYESKRREYACRRWTISMDTELQMEDIATINKLAAQLPVDIQPQPTQSEIAKKCIQFIPADKKTTDPINIQVLAEEWRISWQSIRTNSTQQMRIWKGFEITPLARKARDFHPIYREISQSASQPTIGIHLPLNGLPVDIAATRQMISENPWAYFVFLDVPGKENATIGKKIIEGFKNAAYLGARPFGFPYQLYACLNALWIPPLQDQLDSHLYQQYLALAYAIAKPLIYPKGLNVPNVPFQFFYHSPAESLHFVLKLHPMHNHFSLLDQYLQSWEPVESLNKVLKLCDGITQERHHQRPDFNLKPIPPKTPPKKWTPTHPGKSGSLKVGLIVNTLDQGGLEEVVASLARGLQNKGVKIFVLCTKSGGKIADRLKSENFSISVAQSHALHVQKILDKEKPDLVSTHWVDQNFIQIVASLGIPVYESIHNTYIWLDETGWRNEFERSRCFSHAIAVSDLVKRYYTKWNPVINPKWISIIPNGIDTQRLHFINQADAREQLGIPLQEFVYLNLASYDGRKNQLGLLTAFNRLAQDYPEARLVCAGNIADPHYHEALQNYHHQLPTKDRILLLDYQADPSVWLSAADGFVINSFFEGWSLAATEALLAGLPLIHTDCGSARELVGKSGERGFVIPNPAGNPLDLDWNKMVPIITQNHQPNTEDLVQALSHFINNKETWRKKRSYVKNTSCEMFSFQATIDLYYDLFQNLMQ